MGAFKPFNTNEVTITPFKPEKHFSLTGDDILNAGVDIYNGVNVSFLETNLTSGLSQSFHQKSIHQGAKQLYYSNYHSNIKGDTIPSQSIIPGVTKKDSVFYGAIEAPRYENYLQTNLTQSRRFYDSINNPITIISIPQNLYGEYIKPSSFRLISTTPTPAQQYMDYNSVLIINDNPASLEPYTWYSPYINVYNESPYLILSGSNYPSTSSYSFPTISGSEYTLNYNIYDKSGTWNGRIQTVTDPEVILPSSMTLNVGDNTHTFYASSSLTNMVFSSPSLNPFIKFNNIVINSENNITDFIYDDLEGNLLISENQAYTNGQIFYPHGMVVITNGPYNALGRSVNNTQSLLDTLTLSFTSSLTIYENQYKCTINANEFNYSQNPTLLRENNEYYGFATGSIFTPYITTVGLYDGDHNLLAIGKLSKPIPKSNYIDTTIIINFDTI